MEVSPPVSHPQRKLSGFLLPVLIVSALSLCVPSATGQESDAVRVFQIDSQASQLRIWLYRAGMLSPLSHDHLLVAQGIAGRISLDADNPERSSLQLSIPVESIEVDPAEAREAEGMGEGPDEEDRRTIHETMLSAEYLDGAQHPRIVVTAERVFGAPPQLRLLLNVRVKQHEERLELPVRVTVEGQTLKTSGEALLRQSEFGVEPFSDWGGLLAIKDEVLVRFEILAQLQP